MIVHLSSFRYFWEVYENNEYSFLFDKLRVLDLGCGEGEFSLWIYPRTERIWAVDKEQSLINNFNKSVRSNGLKGIVTITERVIDLAKFMQGHSVNNLDLLKIDVEGDEYEIFKKDFPFIPTIIGEYHRESLEELLTEKGYRYLELPNRHFIARL